MRHYHCKVKLEAIEHYGGKCACCGEKVVEFLTIDHKGGGGNKQLKSINGAISSWLKKHNWPKGFRVLCYNCNCAIGFFGYCPHKEPDKSLKLETKK